MPRPPKVHPDYDDASSSEDEADPAQAYILLFGGLPLAQLSSTSTTPRFKFRRQQKVIALRHAVQHAYTDHLPPSPDVLLDLAYRHLPVPLNHGLAVIEACIRGLQGLITSVFAVAQASGLVRATNMGAAGWKTHVSTALLRWDGTGGWNAIRLCRPHPDALATQAADSMAPFRAVGTALHSELSWSYVMRETMNHFAAISNPAYVAATAGPPISQQSSAGISSSLAPPATPNHSYSFYTLSSYTDQPVRERENQYQAYAVFVAAAKRFKVQLATADDDDTGRRVRVVVEQMLDWNHRSLKFDASLDYVDWQGKMLRKGLLEHEDFREAEANPDP